MFIRQLDSVAQAGRELWSRFEQPDHPFTDYHFLQSLEESGCVGVQTAWRPAHLLVYENEADSRPCCIMPSYIKYDSYGEYIFDFEWAGAFERAGLDYYPKVVSAVPFSPVNGARILRPPEETTGPPAAEVLAAAAQHWRQQGLYSSWHILCCREDEFEPAAQSGVLAGRLSHQFHWHNREYANFGHFLEELKSKRRKEIRRERASIEQAGIEVCTFSGEQIEPAHIDAVWAFYMDTAARKWGRPYLNRAFFDLLYERMQDKLLLVLARRKGQEWIGGSFNLAGRQKLYGRYWGATEYVRNLHFECCYYRLIDYAITHRMHTVEAGAQGEHKFSRAFDAAEVYSLHTFFNSQAEEAIGRFINTERNYIRGMIDQYNRSSVLKNREQ